MVRKAAAAEVLSLVALLAGGSGCIEIISDEEPEKVACEERLSQSFPSNDGTAAAAPLSPLYVGIRICDAEAFFQRGAEVTLLLEPSHMRDDIVGGMVVPAGVVVAGNLSHQGSLLPGKTHELTAVVRAPKSGEYAFRAWGEALDDANGCSRAATSALFGIRDPSGEAEAFAPPPTRHEFDVEIKADSEDLLKIQMILRASVTGTIKASLAIPAHFVSGDALPWEGRIQAGEPVEVNYVLRRGAFPDNGNYTVVGCLYPDPAIDGGLYRDSLLYRVKDGRLRVSEEPRR